MLKPHDLAMEILEQQHVSLKDPTESFLLTEDPDPAGHYAMPVGGRVLSIQFNSTGTSLLA
jgi:hypothetical protein